MHVSMFGVTTMQTYTYYHRYPRDHTLMKSTVRRTLYRSLATRNSSIAHNCLDFGLMVRYQERFTSVNSSWFVYRVLSALHFIFYVETMYYYNVTNFMNPEALAIPPWYVVHVSLDLTLTKLTGIFWYDS